MAFFIISSSSSSASPKDTLSDKTFWRFPLNTRIETKFLDLQPYAFIDLHQAGPLRRRQTGRLGRRHFQESMLVNAFVDN